MRKALIVGIDYYQNGGGLRGCVSDAHSVKTTLERHADGTINFLTPRLLLGTSSSETVTRDELKQAIRELFKEDSEIALLYFSGHGVIDDTGGFLCCSETRKGDDGLPIAEIMTLVHSSPAKNKVILLDSCHSGVAGERPTQPAMSEIKEGVTILTASTANQYAVEAAENGKAGGVFTTLLIDALNGAAANLVGDVTPGSVYAHIDQSLGSWAQRPVFKTNVKTFVSLRKAAPPIPLDVLREIIHHFPTADFQIQLDPSYEPERSSLQDALPPPDPVKNKAFGVLQQYVKVNLVRPVDMPHMWHAAMQSGLCELTVLGQHYHRLVKDGLI